jgi:hypothetical protein
MKFKLILLLVAILSSNIFLDKLFLKNKIIGVNPNVKPIQMAKHLILILLFLGIGREWGLNGMGRNNRYNARD